MPAKSQFEVFDLRVRLLESPGAATEEQRVRLAFKALARTHGVKIVDFGPVGKLPPPAPECDTLASEPPFAPTTMGD